MLVFVIRRRKDRSPEEFHRYWLEVRRYVQAHTTGGELNAALAGPRGTLEPYDGLAEIWWDSLVPLELDERGVNEVAEVLEHALEAILAIRDEGDARSERGDGEAYLDSEVVIAQFVRKN